MAGKRAAMPAFAPPPYPIRAPGAVPAFVGRAVETSAAAEAWAAVRAGGRQVVFIGGEPGAGKSRLAAEVAATAHRAGAVVLFGTCAPEPGGPYQPFAECLEQLLGGTEPGALACCLPDSAAELLRLTPLAWRHRPELTTPPDRAGDYRRELFDAVAELLRAVGERCPVVCVLEDLHWAGQPTLQLLDHVARRGAAARLLLLCTHRTTAPDRSDALTYAIADLYRLDGVRRLDLPGLSAEEVTQYLTAEACLPDRRAREYAAVLREQTGGNPFFLRELWRDMTAASGPPPLKGLLSRTPLPVSVRDTLQRRLAGMSPGERAVLETAGVLGDGGDVGILLRACDTEPGRVLAALDAAVRFGFLDAGELVGGRIVFPHALTRQAVLDLAGPSSQAALHARIGEALRTAAGNRAPGSAAIRQLAHHFTRAAALGHGDTAASYLRQAAREAQRSLAFEDAAAWYARAAGLLGGPEAEREELWFAAADCHLRAGDFASARTLYRRLAGSAGHRARVHAAIGYESAAWHPGLPGTDACALLSHALEGVPADPGDPLYVEALASLGRATAFTGDMRRSRDLAGRALEYARRLGDQQVLLHALQTMLWQPAEPATLGDQIDLMLELSRLARASQDWEVLGNAAVFRCAIAYIQADRAAWTGATADLDLAVRASGEPFPAFFRRCGDYANAFLAGDFAAAARLAEEVLEIGRSFGPDDTEGQYGLQMYMVRRETGALEEIRPLVEVIRRQPGTWEPGLLALYTELGLAREARELLWRLLERADGTMIRQSVWATWTAVLIYLVEAALFLRDVPAARRLRPLLAPYSGQQLTAGQFAAVFGPADAYLAALDSLLGDTASADSLFGSALAQAAAFGAVVHQASVLTAWAAHLGPGERGARLRAKARRLAACTGQARLTRMLDGQEEEAPAAPGQAAAGLTARELAVVRLLAEGSSNREIAARLTITENTAANHVRSILVKTGTANRTQAAMMAVSRGWLAGPARS
ncbi:MAG TPA: AAA family ATPase [Trebonia sp.]|jgi:DNA-binding CsgD family transcriptional regulator